MLTWATSSPAWKVRMVMSAPLSVTAGLKPLPGRRKYKLRRTRASRKRGGYNEVVSYALRGGGRRERALVDCSGAVGRPVAGALRGRDRRAAWQEEPVDQGVQPADAAAVGLRQRLEAVGAEGEARQARV